MENIRESISGFIHEISHKPLKAGIVCEMGMSGSSIVGSSLAEGLCKSGNDVHIISYSKSFSIISKSIPSRLLLLGDGPEKPEMMRLASKLKIKDRVIFAGSVKNVQKYFSASDLFLMASENEGMPLSIIEAMSCKVPAVAVNRGGMPEIVEDGKTGYVAGFGDMNDIAEKCMKIISDDDMIEKFGNNARKRVEEDFDMKKNVAEYERYYRKLMLTQGF